LLGDDIVIGDASVAELYMKVLRSIHVDFSPAKTHKSDKFFEFAKRVFYCENEVTPFPISALLSRGKGVYALTLLIRKARERGWTFIETGSMIHKFFAMVMEFKSSYRKKLELNAKAFDSLLSLIGGTIPAYRVFNDILRKNNIPEYFNETNIDKYKTLYSKSLVELLKSSVSEFMIASPTHSDRTLTRSSEIVSKYIP
jgi:hypothetical protein